MIVLCLFLCLVLLNSVLLFIGLTDKSKRWCDMLSGTATVWVYGYSVVLLRSCDNGAAEGRVIVEHIVNSALAVELKL